MSHFKPGMSNAEKVTTLGAGDKKGTLICQRICDLNPYHLELLDMFDITGDAITRLFEHVAKGDLGKVSQALVACDAGLDGLTSAKLKHAIDNHSEGYDVDDI